MSTRPPKVPNPRITIDTREQRPFLFGWKPAPVGSGKLHEGEVDGESTVVTELGGPWEVELGTVSTGDYALAAVPGYPAPDPLLCFIERKANDIISSLSADRERFIRECERAKVYSFKALIIEHPIEYITREDFRARNTDSRVTVTSLTGSLISIATDRQIQVWPCADRRTAEYFAAWTLRRAWRWHLNEHAKLAKEASEIPSGPRVTEAGGMHLTTSAAQLARERARAHR